MFARMGLRSLILTLLAIVAVFVAPVESQTDTVQMVVRGNQTVNARSCAQLTCAVVVTFAPGTELECNGTTEGDTVNGSDQWVEVAYEDGTVYVHSSLVEPQEPAAAEAAASAGTTSDAATPPEIEISTARWIERPLDGYSVRAPSSWRTPADLLADDDYWRTYTEMYGKGNAADQRETFEQNAGAVENGDYDLVLQDPFGFGTLFVSVVFWTDAPSTRYMQESYSAYLTDTFGMDIVESEIVAMPEGEAIHLTAGKGTGNDRGLADSYCIRHSEDILFIVEVDMFESDASFYLPVTEAVAQSLVVDEDAKRW